MEVNFLAVQHLTPPSDAIHVQENFDLVFKGMRETLWCFLLVRYSKKFFYVQEVV